LLPDVLAGLAVWAVMVPEGMAYARIVGVPPIMGLYTIVPPLVAYALLGTSRLLVVGPDTATGLISSLTVGTIAVQGTADSNSLTSTLSRARDDRRAGVCSRSLGLRLLRSEFAGHGTRSMSHLFAGATSWRFHQPPPNAWNKAAVSA
jgi:Sulfate permease family